MGKSELPRGRVLKPGDLQFQKAVILVTGSFHSALVGHLRKCSQAFPENLDCFRVVNVKNNWDFFLQGRIAIDGALFK